MLNTSKYSSFDISHSVRLFLHNDLKKIAFSYHLFHDLSPLLHYLKHISESVPTINPVLTLCTATVLHAHSIDICTHTLLLVVRIKKEKWQLFL